MAKFERLRSHIPTAYQASVNKFIKGLLEAWATGDDGVAQAILDTKAQLFVATASQQFLDRLGSNVGVVRPASLGMGDMDFRDLVPALSFAPKQVRDVLHKLLEIWYKPEAVYANMVSEEAEPYDLDEGDTLSLVVNKDETVDVTFSFLLSDFADINNATALEVANAINKQAVNLPLRASEYYDSIAKKKYVRLRTTTAGPTGEIRIAGGTAQSELRFPVSRATTQDAGTRWDVQPITGDLVRMEYRSGTNPTLSEVEEGDLTILTGAFSTKNQGNFIISNVVLGATIDGITPGHKYTGFYVEFANATAEVQDVVQADVSDATFYYPKRHDVNAYPRPAVLYEVNHKEIVVVLPATAAVINRTEKGSAHLHVNSEQQMLTLTAGGEAEFLGTETIVGMNAMYLNAPVGGFAEGETLTGLLSGQTATVFKLITSGTFGAVLGVIAVSGGFIAGETVTGSVSGATGLFDILISTTSATGKLDAIIEPNRKFGLQDLTGLLQVGEGLIGRTEMRMTYADGPFDTNELLTGVDSMNLVPPYIGDFVVGETLTGSVSGQTAVVVDIIRNKLDERIDLQISTISGPFSPGEIVTGSVSLAFGTLQGVIETAGATARIETLGHFDPHNMVHTLRLETGVFQNGEVVVGEFGSKAVVGEIASAVGTVEVIETTDDFVSPYIYDPMSAFTPSEAETHTTEDIQSGQYRLTLKTTQMTDEFLGGPGYILFDYGTANQEGPVRYTTKPNDVSLIIDPSFIFQKDHPVGTSVRMLRELEPTDPRGDGSDFAAYVTGLAEARIVLQELIRSVVAAGVTVRFIVVFPEYLFQCYNTNEAV